MRTEVRERIESIVPQYPQRRGALLPAIYLVQEEKGYVDRADVAQLAELFEITLTEVWEVLSFYNMFHTEPQSRHHVYVCSNLPCSLRGARSLLRGLEAHLGIRANQMTPDGRIALGHEECLGSCGTAPVMRVDGEYHENLDLETAKRVIDALE